MLYRSPSVWFSLGSEDETMFCDTQNFTAVDRSLTAVCGRDASGKNSHASQLSTNNHQPSGNCMKTKTFKGILREETAVNFLKGKKFEVILPDF